MLSPAGGWNDHMCGIKSDGTLWCWGANPSGELGNGLAQTAPATSPVEVSGGGNWLDVGTTSQNTCAIKVEGQIFCWGNNTNVLAITINTSSSTPLLGDCGGPPPTQSGGLRYQSTNNVMMYCDGVGFHTIGK